MTRFEKAGFHTYNSKTHFSPSNDSCTRWLTIQPGIDDESCPGCFCCMWLVSEACQMSTSVRVVFKWLHTWSSWQADSWPYVNSPHDWLISLAMDLTALCDMWRWNDTNGCHLAGFGEEVAFARHFDSWLPTHPLPSHPVGVLYWYWLRQ